MPVTTCTSSLYLPLSLSSSRVRASFDTQQRLSYNPNAPRKIKKPPLNLNTNSNSNKSDVAIAKPPTSTVTPTSTDQSVFDLLKHPTQGVVANLDESYMGYERWLPNPPKVEKPRSVFNAASLAYIGDCIYELYARRHFLFPPLSIEEYNNRVMAVVRCETQDALLQKLLNDNYLSAEERDVVRWGKNVGSANTRTKRRAGAAVYNRASSLETLVSILGPCFSFIACQIDKCIMIYSGGCTNGKLSKGRKTLLFSVHQPPLFAYFYLVIASSSLLVLTY
ncbi:RNase III domain-containing protein [Citrus sinensis]|uniref:RNase III domain-containing protein n=1 Tax=Citrus sinensis TaxID=2711 RepID=A0ACB8J7R0_CITSI|nr:RNase III domain-containing protein [Citrus sinensis]